MPPDDGVLDAAWAKLRAGPQGYTLTAGMLELRERIAAHYAIEGCEHPDDVIVTVGSEQAVFLAMTALLNPGDEVLLPEPGYPAYRGIATLIGATPVAYGVERHSGLVARADELQSKLTKRTKAIVLNGPSNPFGTVDSAEELQKIAALADAHDLAIVSDEIYRELYYGDTPPPSVTAFTRRAVFVSGLSKCCALTGQRLGYLIAPSSIAAQAKLAHMLMVTCAPRLAQLVAMEVFAQPELLRSQVPFYRKARAAVVEASTAFPADVTLRVGDGAFYATIDVSTFAAGDPMALAIELFEAEDVLLVPGVAFGPSGDWFWRISYAAGADAVREGLSRVARFLSARVC